MKENLFRETDSDEEHCKVSIGLLSVADGLYREDCSANGTTFQGSSERKNLQEENDIFIVAEVRLPIESAEGAVHDFKDFTSDSSFLQFLEMNLRCAVSFEMGNASMMVERYVDIHNSLIPNISRNMIAADLAQRQLG